MWHIGPALFPCLTAPATRSATLSLPPRYRACRLRRGCLQTRPPSRLWPEPTQQIPRRCTNCAHPRQTDHLFVHVYLGPFVLHAGEAGVTEAILIAHNLGIRVVSIDYRMAPDHPLPRVSLFSGSRQSDDGGQAHQCHSRGWLSHQVHGQRCATRHCHRGGRVAVHFPRRNPAPGARPLPGLAPGAHRRDARRLKLLH